MIRKELLFIPLFTILFHFNLNGQTQVFNLADDFLDYYKQSQNLSDELKLENFRKDVYNKAPKVYENIYKDIKWIGQSSDERILMSVNNFEAYQKKYSELSEKLDSIFDLSISSFQKEFNDTIPEFDVYILNSLEIRAGGFVKIQDKKVLMFGLDRMAKQFDFQNYTPFFHHELTHLYHSLYYHPCDTGKFSKGAIYNFLWREGLAVYVSSVFNPDATEKEIFMLDSLPQKANKKLEVMAQEINENLFSSDKELIRKYFWGSSADSIIPKTSGYYLGYILAKEIAKEYSLGELIKLKEEIFIPKFEQILSVIYASHSVKHLHSVR